MTVYFVNGDKKHFDATGGVTEEEHYLIVKTGGHGYSKTIIIPFCNVLYIERD